MGDLSKIDWSYYADDRIWEAYKQIIKPHNDDLVKAYAENPNKDHPVTPEITASILEIYRIYEDCLSGKKGKGSADRCLGELDRMRASALRKTVSPQRSSKSEERIERIRARQALAELRIQRRQELEEARIEARKEIVKARIEESLQTREQREVTRERLARMKEDLKERRIEARREIKERKIQAREAKTEAQSETAQQEISAQFAMAESREETKRRKIESERSIREKKIEADQEIRRLRLEARERDRQEKRTPKTRPTRTGPRPFLELGWMPADTLSLKERPEISLNSGNNLTEGGEPYHFPNGFEGGAGISFPLTQSASLQAMVGAGTYFRETGQEIPQTEQTYLKETRFFVGLEPLVYLPKDHPVQFVFGGGGRLFGSLLTSKPLGTVDNCLVGDNEGGCLESIGEEAYGIPSDDADFIELHNQFGFGGLIYGKVGINMGPVGLGLRAGPQFLVFKNPEQPERQEIIGYSGPFVGIDAQVRF